MYSFNLYRLEDFQRLEEVKYVNICKKQLQIRQKFM